MKKTVCCLIAVVMLIGMFLACAPAPAPAPAPKPAPKPTPAPAPKAEPIVLKAISYFAETHLAADGFAMYLERLHEAANGELVIELVGGPEAIPSKAQPEALRTGVVDVALTTGGRYEPLIPEVLSLALSQLTPTEERETGYYDLIAKQSEKAGVVYLGRTMVNMSFHLWTNVRVETPYELAGLKFRGSGFYNPVYKALAIVPVSMNLGDIYEGMNRGLVVGWPSTPTTAITYHLWEVTKYMINPGFWGAQNTIVLVNLDSWNRLPKHLQDLMIDVMAEYEPVMAEYHVKVEKELLQRVQDEGIEPIEFSPADAKWYSEAVTKLKWADLMDKSPELGPRIKEMITK